MSAQPPPADPPDPPERDDDLPEPPPTPEDLTVEQVTAVVGERPLRTFGETTSTEAQALAWTQEGAPAGALVVAGHQAGPRGRSGLSWGYMLERGHGLGFSLVVDSHERGWVYLAGLLALAEGLRGEDLRLEWPDKVLRGGEPAAGISVRQGRGRSGDQIVNVLVPATEPPRTEVVGQLVEALEARLGPDGDTDEVLEAYRARCDTLGRRVRARLLPLGPSASSVTGVADDVRGNGALLIQTPEGEVVPVTPDELGFLEDPDDASGPRDEQFTP